MIAVRTDFKSPRLTYVCETVFRKWFGVAYAIVKAEGDLPANTPFISYGTAVEGAVLSIYEEGLLRENHLRKELPSATMNDGSPVIFKSAIRDFDFSYDLFAAIFFCLSRYEEYAISDRDRHGRFEAARSVFRAYHDRPYLDAWVRQLELRLISAGVIAPMNRDLTWYNTLDVDIAFAYRGRSPFRTLGAAAKDAAKLRHKRFYERISVLKGSREDAFDTFSLFCATTGGKKVVFWQAGGRTAYDLSLDLSLPASREALRQLKPCAEIGLHPSYDTPENPNLLMDELAGLEEASEVKIERSRQHFLRISLPKTYRNLVTARIQTDFSLGFSETVGFRAGTAHSFAFFDLEANAPLPLELIPSIAMDSALKNYLTLSPEEATEKLGELVGAMKSTGGYFTTIWHNHSLSETGEWKGWRKVYEAIPRILSIHG